MTIERIVEITRSCWSELDLSRITSSSNEEEYNIHTHTHTTYDVWKFRFLYIPRCFVIFLLFRLLEYREGYSPVCHSTSFFAYIYLTSDFISLLIEPDREKIVPRLAINFSTRYDHVVDSRMHVKPIDETCRDFVYCCLFDNAALRRIVEMKSRYVRTGIE